MAGAFVTRKRKEHTLFLHSTVCTFGVTKLQVTIRRGAESLPL